MTKKMATNENVSQIQSLIYRSYYDKIEFEFQTFGRSNQLWIRFTGAIKVGTKEI